jgi:hypothetical protein
VAGSGVGRYLSFRSALGSAGQKDRVIMLEAKPFVVAVSGQPLLLKRGPHELWQRPPGGSCITRSAVDHHPAEALDLPPNWPPGKRVDNERMEWEDETFPCDDSIESILAWLDYKINNLRTIDALQRRGGGFWGASDRSEGWGSIVRDAFRLVAYLQEKGWSSAAGNEPTGLLGVHDVVRELSVLREWVQVGRASKSAPPRAKKTGKLADAAVISYCAAHPTETPSSREIADEYGFDERTIRKTPTWKAIQNTKAKKAQTVGDGADLGVIDDALEDLTGKPQTGRDRRRLKRRT